MMLLTRPAWKKQVRGTLSTKRVALEDISGSHVCSLQTSMRVTNVIPLSTTVTDRLAITTVNSASTLKGGR
jgi:hypothetical protein